MPTYSYACTECEHRFDTVQSFSDPALNACPQCSGRLRKLFSSVGIVFKGSGFYRTDSRASSGSKDSKETASKESAEPTGKDASAKESSGKSDGGSNSSGSNSSGSNSSGSKARTASTPATS